MAMKTILQLKSTKLYSSRQFDLFVVRIYYLRRLPLKILHSHDHNRNASLQARTEKLDCFITTQFSLFIY